MTLEQQLTALLEKHDLSAIALSAYRNEDGAIFFDVVTHVPGICATSNYHGGDRAFGGLIKDSIRRMNDKRAPAQAVAA